MSTSLEKRTTASLLTWLPFVMLGGCVFFYLLMRGHVYHMQEQQLELKQANVWNAFRSGAVPLHIKGEYDIERGSAPAAAQVGRQRDTSLYYAGNGWDVFAILTRQYRLGRDTYRVTTYFSSKEITHLLIKISVAEAVIFLSLLGAIVVINRKTSRRVWMPFYDAMEAIQHYDIVKNKPLTLAGQTGIDEFDRLNLTLMQLIERVCRSYDNQKQFTENASHELQTPLAIIRSKVELLMDAPDLTADIATLLADINEANERLSQMNKNLLLLTKIDNDQFPEKTPVAMTGLLQRLIAYNEEYYGGNMLKIDTCVETDLRLQANSALMEILVNNLLRNAILHNVPGGFIHIRLTDEALQIENSGPRLEGDVERLFGRFEKGRKESQTTGLGLALVKQICQLYGFGVRYIHSEGKHCVRISFGQA
ncbi:MAG TPA: HAMP domain-containing sensor histidine kinase [Puia sp.]|nr:HAMP domain-containing sensor histidine kinase [Puia sp.]